jgi:hypothetical protein
MATSRRGRPGPPGPAGAQGKTGKTGARGLTGPAGPQGKIGATSSGGAITVLGRDRLVHDIDEHLEMIYRELDIQLKRMAQIQVQVDELRAKVKALTDPSAST